MASIAFCYHFWAVAFTKRRNTNLKQITVTFTPSANIGASAKTIDIRAYFR